MPLQLNGQVITGYATSRALSLRFYQHAIPIDEGDLYGGIGHDFRRPDQPAELKILTNGIWITSIKPPLPPGIRGVIGYERIHKTASQYNVVKDERRVELIERLKVYVDQILYNRGFGPKQRLHFLFNLPPAEIGGFEMRCWMISKRRRLQARKQGRASTTSGKSGTRPLMKR